MKKQVVETIHEVTVPDELLAWGRDVAVCRSWARPWAHEVDRLLERGSKGPLSVRWSKALYARLEALCAEAIDAGQGELLLGFDTYSAAKLGLRFTFVREGDPDWRGRDEGPSHFRRGVQRSHAGCLP